MKVLAIIGGTLLVLIGLAVGAGIIWFEQNKEELRVRGQAAQSQGASFGASSSQEGCVDESLSRLDQCGGLICEVMVKFFLKACLKAAPSQAGFCGGVPASGEIMASVNWTMGQCSAHDHPLDQPCARLMGAIQEHCSTP
jgi:hypothetical protein